MAEIKITKDNFENEVMHSDKPVLIDFWASWCGPCKMIAPIIEEIADEYASVVKVCKVNVDDEPLLASSFKVVSIPTLVVVNKGKAIATAVGYMPKEDVVSLVKKALS